jgi:N-terminal domain of ribose phosphate pyrophosphokinase
MTGITASSEKKMMLFSGRAYPELGDEIAGCLGIEATPARLYDFANGEIFVRFLESVRGCDAFVLQSHTAPTCTRLRSRASSTARSTTCSRCRSWPPTWRPSSMSRT